MKVRNKVFVVTGAGGGIGSELCLTLVARGATVAAVDLKDKSLLLLKERAGRDSEKISTHNLNISDRNAVERLPKEVLENHGKVDGLINNAGIIQPFVKINDLDYETITRVMNVNFYGTLYMVKAFLPHLIKRPQAYIANISSMGGFLPVPGQSVYGASKAAVKLLSEGLYEELLNTNVGVSVVYPGAINTNITQNSGVKVPSVVHQKAKHQAFKMLPPSEAAEVIVRGIEQNKPQIFVGKDSNTMNKLYRLSPIFAMKLITTKMRSLLENGQ